MAAKSFVQITSDVSAALDAMRREVPDAMKGFSDLSRAAMKEGSICALNKELIALAIGVAGHCDGCIGFHTKALVRLGVSRGALMETLAVAVYMGGGPSLMYAADAVHAFDEFAAARAT